MSSACSATLLLRTSFSLFKNIAEVIFLFQRAPCIVLSIALQSQGRSLEESLRREVKEDVGIAVQNIRYIEGQPGLLPILLRSRSKTYTQIKKSPLTIATAEKPTRLWLKNLSPVPKGSAAFANPSIRYETEDVPRDNGSFLTHNTVVNIRNDENLPRTLPFFYFNLFVMASPTSDVLDLPPMSWVFTFPSANTSFIAFLTPLAA